jgi:hypothetical protein
VNTLQQSNKPLASQKRQKELEHQHGKDALPEFLLSPVSPCLVELVPDPAQQTSPSKTQAELLADGQCEV